MRADVTEHWLAPEVYLEAIARETARLRECLEVADPGARVPTCPQWSGDDLLWHLGGDVQHFWAWVIAHRPEAPEAYVEPTRPHSRDELLAVLDQAHEDLLLRLRNADPAEAAWSWASDPRLHTVGFTLRRQAHEALIHRVDAELTVGAPTPLDPQLAADGVAECLEVMYGGVPSWGHFADDGTRVLVHATDVGRRVLVAMGRFTGHDPGKQVDVDEDDVHVLDVAAHGHVGVDASVRASAQDLDLWLWHRGPAHLVETDGDEQVLDRLAAVLRQSID